MWYPFKFRNSVFYSWLGGELALVHGGPARGLPRRLARRLGRALAKDDGFGAAYPGGDWRVCGLDEWLIGPDQCFRSVTVHYHHTSGKDLWMRTSIGLRSWWIGEEGSHLKSAELVVDGRLVQLAFETDSFNDTLPSVEGFRPIRDVAHLLSD